MTEQKQPNPLSELAEAARDYQETRGFCKSTFSVMLLDPALLAALDQAVLDAELRKGIEGMPYEWSLCWDKQHELCCILNHNDERLMGIGKTPDAALAAAMKAEVEGG